MRIEVTESDIKNGVAEDMDSCPIALAAGRAVGKAAGLSGSWPVRVSNQFLGMYQGEGEPYSYLLLPNEASIFVHDFDFGRKVEPFSFEVGEPFQQRVRHEDAK